MPTSGDKDTSGQDVATGGQAAPDDTARELYERFLPPEPFRGVDPDLYALRPAADLVETVRAWHVAQRWSSTDRDAGHALHHAEAHLRYLSPAAMALYDEQRSLGAAPELAMTAAGVELQTEVVMALLDELEVEAAERGLRGADRDRWAERQVENLTDVEADLPTSDRAAVVLATRYRSLVASMPAPADRWLDGLGPSTPAGHLAARVMTPDEAAAFLAEYPDLAPRVEEHGRELAREYGSRLSGAPGVAETAGDAVDGAPTGPKDIAREEVGGLLGYILSNGATGLLGLDGIGGDGGDDSPVEDAAGEPCGTPELDGADGASLDW